MAASELLATVSLLENRPQSGLMRGQVGTVVEVLSDTESLIEFADLDGRAIAIEALSADQLLVLHHAPAGQLA